eukprot:1388685-Pleurochrysis_carterae.AAC.1
MPACRVRMPACRVRMPARFECEPAIATRLRAQKERYYREVTDQLSPLIDSSPLSFVFAHAHPGACVGKEDRFAAGLL